MPGTALTWTVLLHHNTHIHTFVGSTGATGSFQTEYHGVGDYAYELVLTATDSSGLSRTVRRLLPLTPDTTPPTTPGSLTATIVGSDIRLTWAASTDNYGVDGYRLERCQGVACSTFALIASPTAITYTDTGLALDASYSYRVRAVDAAGLSSAYSNVASATTPRAAISVVRSTPTGTVNLSATNDWVHWGLSTSATVTRKAGVAPSIGAVTIVGGRSGDALHGPSGRLHVDRRSPTTTATTNAAIYVVAWATGSD